ncbi:MAG: homoserine dehydrogenase [Firmicutes bacterium]|nr:homoserine dehydrogenase [Bacillota bacterium]
MKNVNIAILGLGTVGGGTYEILSKLNKKLIETRTGINFTLTKVLERDMSKLEALGIDPSCAVTDPDLITNADDVDIVVESLGGIDFPADIMEKALLNGKSVVTPNKAAVAANFERLNKAAKASGAQFRFEASVGGGIPALTAIKEALAGNRFTEVMGIVNGTTNYILTKMGEEGWSYEEALKDAQKKGFAEADPTADVEGIDAANKLSILTSLCFDEYIPPEEITREGISGVTMSDIEEARSKGGKIKLIASAKKRGAILSYSVKPTFIPNDHPLAGVSNEFNAIYVTGNAVGELMFYGKGAGALPTGSAVVGDIIAIANSL